MILYEWELALVCNRGFFSIVILVRFWGMDSEDLYTYKLQAMNLILVTLHKCGRKMPAIIVYVCVRVRIPFEDVIW